MKLNIVVAGIAAAALVGGGTATAVALSNGDDKTPVKQSGVQVPGTDSGTSKDSRGAGAAGHGSGSHDDGSNADDRDDSRGAGAAGHDSGSHDDGSNADDRDDSRGAGAAGHDSGSHDD
ncbi:hypothetical protein AB0P24_21180, partial [Streptomyces sp. NPDC086519]